MITRLVLALTLLVPAVARAACLDAAAVATTRADAAAACPCDGFTKHGLYVACVRGVAEAAVTAGTLPPECRKTVVQCAAKSTCGRPGWVTCCRERQGVTRCQLTRDAARCAALGGQVGGCPSCCDACAPGGCPTTTTTVTTTTSTTTTTLCPPNHCGDGVVQGMCGEECDATECPAFSAFTQDCGAPGGPDECNCCAPPGGICGFAEASVFSCCAGRTCVSGLPDFPFTLRYCGIACAVQGDCAPGTACVCGGCHPTTGTCTQHLDCPLGYMCRNGGCFGPVAQCGGCPPGWDCEVGNPYCVPVDCPQVP